MYGTIEYLAQHWDYTAESIQEKISQFNYIDDNVQNRFTLIYTQLYKIILSVNAILEQIDAKQDVFEPGMYEIIKGECLAMRAYCHFDLLRLFGPMPTRTTASKILPYVTKVGIGKRSDRCREIAVPIRPGHSGRRGQRRIEFVAFGRELPDSPPDPLQLLCCQGNGSPFLSLAGRR